MAATRKRSATKHKGTAGTPKTAQRKSPQTKARTKTTGRVKGAHGGPPTHAHPQSEPTKRASSRKRAAEAGEPVSEKRAKAAPKKAALTDGDVAKIPTLRRVRARDAGENSG
jgi:hypothetical protein